MANKIKNIIAREIINSRGYPTLEAKLITDDNLEVIASYPSFERLFDYQNFELQDNDQTRFAGRGVSKAVYYINNLIATKLKGVSIEKQIEIDNWLNLADQSKNKQILGVNTLHLISRLITKINAKYQQISLYQYINQLFNKIAHQSLSIEKLPSPIFPLLRGGRHSQANLDFKEFQIIPSSAFSYSKAYQLGVDFYHLIRHLYNFNFVFNLDVLSAIKEAIEKKNLILSQDVFIGIDFGASFYRQGNRYFIKDRQQPITIEEYINFIEKSIFEKYPSLIITDPFASDDWQNWIKFNQIIPKETYLAADELISNNKERLEKTIKDNLFSAIIIKPNQISTITDSLNLISLLKENEIAYIIASDLEETNDDFVADFAVGVGSEFVNFGPPVHGENIAKYNRLLEIEKEINK